MTEPLPPPPESATVAAEDVPATDPSATEGLRARRLPPWVILVAVWLAAGAVLPSPALREIGAGGALTDVTLHRPISYILLSPILGWLDLLTFLTPAQHGAVLLTALGLFIGLRTRRGGRGPRRPAWMAWGALGLGVVTVYGAGALLPRPTPTLRVADPDLVRVDFHSHTAHSHDVGDRFTPEWNRAWHERLGFDVAWVSDHRTWAGVAAAREGNPVRAGNGVVLLSAVEVWFRTQHAIGLGDSTRYVWTLDPERRRFEVDSIRRRPPADPLTLVFALPGDLDRVSPLTGDNPAGVIAIEAIDGSPRGLAQGRADRDRIVALADSLNLALVGSTNGHGYGQAAPGWTLMRVPGWREMRPQTLGAVIEDALHRSRRGATRVIERTVPTPERDWLHVLTVPALAWHLTTTLSTGERTVWLLWLLVAWTVWRLRRVPPGDPAEALDP